MTPTGGGPTGDAALAGAIARDAGHERAARSLDGVGFVLVTGMSGAGRSSAARALEDLGWFVVDNLPPQLLVQTLEVITQTEVDRVAVVADARGGRLFTQLRSAIDDVQAQGADLRILYLEANDDALVRRFESSRRPHPLQAGGRLLDAIVAERAILGDVRAAADLIIDTSQRSIHDLRRAIDEAFESGENVLRATIVSFGFKYGLPADADFVADVRFLPNPYWVPELKDRTGREAPVAQYVLAQRGADEFLQTLTHLVGLVADGYLAEGKRFAMIAVGCTGGKHRSVAMVEQLAARLAETGLAVSVVHRDLGRE